jgi:hypothetical protein
MSTKISILAEVHAQEQAHEIAFLRNRQLVLAQSLFEAERERDRLAEEVERISIIANKNELQLAELKASLEEPSDNPDQTEEDRT